MLQHKDNKDSKNNTPCFSVRVGITEENVIEEEAVCNIIH